MIDPRMDATSRLDPTQKQIAEDLSNHIINQAQDILRRVVQSSGDIEVANAVGMLVPLKLFTEAYSMAFAVAGVSDNDAYLVCAELAKTLVESIHFTRDMMHKDPTFKASIDAARAHVRSMFKI